MLANRVRMGLYVGVKPEDIADANCKVATDADFSGTSNWSFKYIGTATCLVIPHVIKGVKVTNYYEMFSGSNVVEVRSNNPNITHMGSMFYGCDSLTSLNISNFDTSNVTDMGYMFYGCDSLTSLNISNFDTSNVTNMRLMFKDCSSLTSLNVSSFNTSKVTDMEAMFSICNSLTSLNVSSFNTSKVTSMREMFAHCRGLTSLDLSSFDTSKVTDVISMFYGSSAIKTAYARTQADANKFNGSLNKPSNVNFVVK